MNTKQNELSPEEPGSQEESVSPGESESLGITAYSTALFSTWIFVEPFGVLFDCGDGVSAGLLQKARKVKHAFISHADRDHVSGLLQFNQLNGRSDLCIHYPKDCGTFPALEKFCADFDPHTTAATWSPMEVESRVDIRRDLVVRTMGNTHVPKVGTRSKSLSFFVDQVSRRLKPQYRGLEGAEIARLRESLGQSAITDEARTTELVYSGDTPVIDDGRYQNAKVLIHEATFLTDEEIEPDNPKRNKHSSLEAVIRMAAEANLGRLILSHFSSRFSAEQIDEAIAREVKRYGLKIPVDRILPGQIARF